MTFEQRLQSAIRTRHPEAVCLGGVCYLGLPGGNLAKAELTSGGGRYNGLRLTVLNRRNGPVDCVVIHTWAVPDRETAADQKGEAWDVCRSLPDIDGLWALAEEYLRLFREPDLETR